MRKIVVNALITCALAVVPIALSSRVKAADPMDNRLKTKVTYQGGYKRLHSVADEVAKQTGVTIRVGNNIKDWRVRDIPLIVCVRDLPLGELLKAMADAAHLQFVVEMKDVSGTELPVYRLHRDTKHTKALDSYPDASADANMQLANWAWDALVEYARMPDAKLDFDSVKMNGTDIGAAQIKTVASILASLSPEVRTRAFAGEQVDLKANDLQNPSLFTKLFDYASTLSFCENQTRVAPTDSERKNAVLSLKVDRSESASPTAGFSFRISGIPVLWNMQGREKLTSVEWQVEPVTMARALAKSKLVKIPAMPDVESALAANDSFPTAGFRHLENDDDWKLPFLQEKVQVKLAPGVSPLRMSDALPALAKCAGVNIVCEDFLSHKNRSHQDANVDASPNANISSVLEKLSSVKEEQVDWFANEASRLLVGWHPDWRRKHLHLVSEDLLRGIREKCDSTGAELDDLVPLMLLTEDQLKEWVIPTDNINFLYNGDINVSSETRGLWEIYAALNKNQREVAKSDAGLSLMQFDTVWLSNYLPAAKKRSDTGKILIVHGQMPKEVVQKLEREKRVLADPGTLRLLSLGIISEPVESWHYLGKDRKFHTYRSGSDGIPKHSYSLVLRGELDGEKLEIISKWHEMRFPVYSSAIESEMLQKALSTK